MTAKKSEPDTELGTEPGIGKLIDQEGPIATNIAVALLRHPTDDEIDLSANENLLSTANMPPDGQATATIESAVTDSNGNPVPGITVQFALSYVRPGGNWRSANGLKRLYDQNGGNGTKARNLVNSGVIRVIGSLSARSATTDSAGIARVTYRTSHIGSNFSQSSQAREKIVSTLPNGSTSTLNIDVGWTGLQKIQTVSGGLRIIGATGRHVHPDLRSYLKSLGDAVKGAGWPYPVTVTAAGLRWGGQYPPHFTHKHGLTLDLRPMSTDGNSTWAKADGTSAANYDAARTKALISTLKQSAPIVYFNGKGAGGTQKAGHDNHIHVSWLSSNVATSGVITI